MKRMEFYTKAFKRENMTEGQLFFADHGDKKIEALSQYDEKSFTVNDLYRHFKSRMLFELKGRVNK